MPVSRFFLLFVSFAVVASPAFAQLAPTPKKAPRAPVKSETLQGKNRSLPVSRLLTGRARILDTEKLNLQGFDLRLFGIVPPQVSAPLGPQARTALDALAAGEVTCKVMDRERSGPYLATCRNEAGADFGLELLRRGLAVAARGSLEPTEFARAYLAAEQAAQNQHLGLWETKIPSPASQDSIRKAAQEAQEAKEALARLVAEKEEAEKMADSLRKETGAEEMPEPSRAAQTALLTPPLPSSKPEEAVPSGEETASSDDAPPSLASPAPTAEQIQALLAPDPVLEQDIALLDSENLEKRGWLERHQIFATGILLFLSFLAYLTSLRLARGTEKRGELSALAAALRGELMAARAIAHARISRWSQDINLDEKTAAWPRIRTLVFQAHVGKLGLLGADMARQLASIYGQAADFASYYGGDESKHDIESKKQSLQKLFNHIEEVLPRLESIEACGALDLTRRANVLHDRISGPDGGGGHAAPLALSDGRQADGGAESSVIAPKATGSGPSRRAAFSENRAAERLRDFLFTLSEKLRNARAVAIDRIESMNAQASEDLIPDYANLTEDEIEALSADDYLAEPAPRKSKRT